MLTVPNTSFEIYAPNFLEKFLESHTVMFQGNSGLKPKEGEITSQPWQWPINFKVGNNYYILIFVGVTHRRSKLLYRRLFYYGS